MNTLKNLFKAIASFFVSFRFRNANSLREYLHENRKYSGILATVYSYTMDKYGSYISLEANIGKNIYYPHGPMGVFISKGATIGDNAVIFQQVTIGSNTIKDSKRFGSPTIGNNCYIGAGAKIIGNVHIGNNCRIGANAVVYEDMEDNSVAVNSKTRIIKKDEELDNRFYLKDDNGNLIHYENGSFRKE